MSEHRHMHWHPGLNHDHPHEHGERNHHAPSPFGKSSVIEMPDPVLIRQLRESIEKAQKEKAK